jgi:hypothetical protein
MDGKSSGMFVDPLFKFLGLLEKYPTSFVQLLAAATMGLALIGFLTWADKRRPGKEQFAAKHNPVKLLWPFEILALVILVEWFALLTIGEGMDLPLHSH